MNTLYSLGRLEEMVDVAVNLKSELNWIPTYWVTQPELENAVAERFPKAIRHDFNLANRGVYDPIPKSALPTIPPQQLTSDGHLYRQGLEIVARHVLGNVLVFQQQAAFYDDRLSYALGVVQALDLQLMVLPDSPHCPIDFAFYNAFRILGRKVRIVHLTGFRGLQVIRTGPEDGLLGFEGDDHAGSLVLSEEGLMAKKEVSDRSSTSDPWYVQRQKTRDEAQARLYSVADKLLSENRIPVGMVSFDECIKAEVLGSDPTKNSKAEKAKRNKGWARFRPLSKRDKPLLTNPKRAPEDVFKRKFLARHDEPMRRAFAFRAKGFSEDPITWRHYYTYRDWMLLTKQRWLRRYNQLCSEFDLEHATAQPYCLFALHYQPERTTCPEGGVFSDQIKAIRTISQSLPEGWSILVKEHPSQFMWQTEGELGRWEGYYEQILECGNIELVPLDVSTAYLVKHSKAVVTVTGTVGWEAMVSGIPTVVMSRPWYATEGGTLFVRDRATMSAALKKIANGWRPDQRRIDSHLAKLEQIGQRCYVNPSHAPHYEGLTVEENVKNLTSLIVNSEQLAGE